MQKILFMCDVDFYDKYVSKLPFKDQVAFFKEFPEFLQYEKTMPQKVQDSLKEVLDKLL